MRSVVAFSFLCAAASSVASPFSGRILDEKGTAISGAKLVFQIYDRNAKPGQNQLRFFSVNSGTDGRFTFDDLPEEHPLALGVILPNGHASMAVFEKPEQSVTVADKASKITLKVTDETGRPIPGAFVHISGPIVESNGNGYSLQQSVKPVVSTPSEKDGTIDLPNVSGNLRYYYECGAPGFPSFQGNFKLDDPQKPDLTVVLSRGATLRGRVTYKGHPIKGALVNVLAYVLKGGAWQGTSVRGQSDQEGKYEIVAPVGTYQLSANLSGPANLVSASITGIHSSAGGELDGLDIPLVPPIEVIGKVLERGTDKPVKGARIDGESSSPITGDDGSFRLKVPPGSHQFRVQHVGDQELPYPYPSVDSVIDAKHHDPITFYVNHEALLPPIKHLEGTVIDVNGKPVPSARVSIVGDERSVTADDRGHFVYPGDINPGAALYATGKGKSLSRPVSMIDQKIVSLKLDSPAIECSGRAVDDAGKPVPDADVTLFGEKGNFVFRVDAVTTSNDGSFHFSNLFVAMPSYCIEIKKKGFVKGDSFDHEVKPGQSIAVGDVKLIPADDAIGGMVVNGSGHPVAGITVSCGFGESETLTDKQGKFRFSNVARGKNNLNVQSIDGHESGSAEGMSGHFDILIKTKTTPVQASTMYSDMSGQIAGKLTLGAWLTQNHLDLNALKGKIVLIDLWAVWCGPCIHALPEVQALYKRYHKFGVEVIGVHVAGTPIAKALAFVKQKGLAYPTMMDTKEGTNALTFPAKGIPQLYVIAPSGKIICDSHDVSDAEVAIKSLLKR